METAQAFWDITITQIECPTAIIPARPVVNGGFGLPNRAATNIANVPKSKNYDLDLIAPPGCDQFFLEEHRRVQSFNYNNGVGPYPREIEYTICIKRRPDATYIR